MLFSPLLLAAAASPPLEGVVAQTISVGLSAAGAVDIAGASAPNISVTLSGEGAVAVSGSASQAIPVTLATAGGPIVSGVAAQTITIVQSAGSSLTIQGETTQTIQVMQGASGEIEVVKATTFQNDRISRENLTWHQFGALDNIGNLAEKYFFGYTSGVAEANQAIAISANLAGAVEVKGASSAVISVTLNAAGSTGGVAGGGNGAGGARDRLAGDRVSRGALVQVHAFGHHDPSLATLAQDYFFGEQEGVFGDASQAITVTQSASGNVATALTGALNKQIAITQVARGGYLFATGAKLITIGDSILQFGNNRVDGASNSFSNQGWGEITWAMFRSPQFRHVNYPDPNALNSAGGPVPHFRGANFGLASDWATHLVADRMPEILNSGADIAVINIGTNKGTTDASAGPVITAINSLVSQLRSRGIFMILGVIRPRNIQNATPFDPAYKATRDAITAHIRTLAAADVMIWDMIDEVLDPSPIAPLLAGSPYPWSMRDGVHPQILGAYEMSKPLNDLLSTIIAPGTWFDANPLTANLITNGSLTGSTSSAVVSPKVTGVGPTGWNARNDTATNLVSAVASLEANAETGGQTWVFDVTTQGDGDIGGGGTFTEEIAVRPPALSIAGLGLQPTDFVQFYAEIEVEANAANVIGRVQMVVDTNTQGPWGGVGNLRYRGLGQGDASVQTSPYPSEAYSGWIQTEPILVGSNTSISPKLAFEGRRDVSAALSLSERTCRVKLKRMILRTVEDPRITFPFEKRGAASSQIAITQTGSGSVSGVIAITGQLSKTIPVLQSASALVPAAQGRGRFPLHSSRHGREALVKNHAFSNQGTAAAQVSGDYFFGYQKPKGVLKKVLSVAITAAGLASRIGNATQNILVTQTASAEMGGGSNALIDYTGAFLTDHTGAFIEPFLLVGGQADQDILVTCSGAGTVAETQDGGLVDSTGAFLSDANGDFLQAQQSALGDAAQAIPVTQVAAGLVAVSGVLSKAIPVTQSAGGDLGTVDGQLFDATGAFLTDFTGSPLAEVLGIQGEAGQTIAIGQAAAGDVENVILGAAAQTIAVTLAAAVGVAIVGEASQPIEVEQIASQTVTVSGRATQRIDVTQASDGVLPVQGSATQPITVVQVSVGLAPSLGTASQPIAVVQVSTGLTVYYQGQANQIITVGQAAVGSALYFQGAASQTIAVTQAAAAANPVVGAASQPIQVAQSASVLVFTNAAANQNIPVVQVAAGGLTDVTQPTVISGIASLLNAVAGVYRNTPISDGRGGWIENLVLVGTVQCRVSSPSGRDQQVAEQRQASVTHAIYMGSDADIRLGDMLQINATWHYVAVPDLRPSVREHHLKILTEERQRRAA